MFMEKKTEQDQMKRVSNLQFITLEIATPAGIMRGQGKYMYAQ